MSTSAKSVPVRLLTQLLGSPAGDAGDIVWVSEAVSLAWVSSGLAEPLNDESAPEAAVLVAPEAAVRRRGRPRKVS